VNFENYLRMLSCVNFFAELLTDRDPRLDVGQDEIKKAWEDPSKEHIREGIRNYVYLMEKLEIQTDVPGWREFAEAPMYNVTMDYRAWPVIERQRNNFNLFKSLIAGTLPAGDAPDVAMAADVKPGTKGGIDLDPAQMSLDVKKEGEGFQFNGNWQDIDAQNITGAEFVIRRMTPVTDLPLILGISH